MFKRRNPKPFWRAVSDWFYPSIGWKRWFELLRRRIKRLPDSPHRIAMGLAVGVGVTFTPVYGFHFLTAAIVAFILRGNVLAAIIATFVGNPVTFPIIAVICYKLGTMILGIEVDGAAWPIVAEGFREAWVALRTNFWSLFGYPYIGWDGFNRFMWQVFVPYTVGGLIPGTLLGIGVYFASHPLIEAYQNRRRGLMAEKLKEWRERLQEARERVAQSDANEADSQGDDRNGRP
ncbi:MAG: DUF2062 domain-containing protein [Pseudomonadota bacterium]